MSCDSQRQSVGCEQSEETDMVGAVSWSTMNCRLNVAQFVCLSCDVTGRGDDCDGAVTEERGLGCDVPVSVATISTVVVIRIDSAGRGVEGSSSTVLSIVRSLTIITGSGAKASSFCGTIEVTSSDTDFFALRRASRSHFLAFFWDTTGCDVAGSTAASFSSTN